MDDSQESFSGLGRPRSNREQTQGGNVVVVAPHMHPPPAPATGAVPTGTVNALQHFMTGGPAQGPLTEAGAAAGESGSGFCSTGFPEPFFVETLYFTEVFAALLCTD